MAGPRWLGLVSGMLRRRKLNAQFPISDVGRAGMKFGATRRSLLALCGVVGAMAALGRRSHADPRMSDVDFAKCVSGLFSDLTGCKRLGWENLNSHTEEADIGILVALLCGPDFGVRRLVVPAILRRSIAQRCAQDFQNDRITHIDGWVLARTEARACALVALI